MLNLGLDRVRTVLCLGAHADDIEIGCGGTLLRLAEEVPQLRVHWVVFSSAGERAAEAAASAEKFLEGAAFREVSVKTFRDSYFPADWAEIKEHFERLGREVSPDLVFTHRREDLHQDHRVLAELTWCAFRNHWILEYEIPKYEGDLGHPNVLVPLSGRVARAKADYLVRGFPSQRGKPWFSAETFLALARLRGVESQAPDGYAEGFYCRKLVL